MKKDLILSINEKKLLGKTITLKDYGKEYVVVRAFFIDEDSKDYARIRLILLNKNSFKKESDYLKEVEKIQNTLSWVYLNDLKASDRYIDVIVIDVNDPLLRDKIFEDFEILHGYFRAYLYQYSNDFDSFSAFVDENNKPITNPKNLDFPLIVKGLRKIFSQSMDKESKQEYLQQYHHYCEKFMRRCLNRSFSLVVRRTNELIEEKNKLDSERQKIDNALTGLEENVNNIKF